MTFLKLLRGQEWPRILVIAILSACLLYVIFSSTAKLLEWRIGSTEIVVDAEEIMLPSITICSLPSDENTNKSATVTTYYDALPKLLDILAVVHQRVSVKNV